MVSPRCSNALAAFANTSQPTISAPTRQSRNASDFSPGFSASSLAATSNAAGGPAVTVAPNSAQSSNQVRGDWRKRSGVEMIPADPLYQAKKPQPKTPMSCERGSQV